MIDFVQARRNMVDNQVRPFDVTDHAVLKALDEVARERFLPEAARPIAYLDRQVEVGAGRKLLAPMIFARMAQALAIRPGERALDVACGLGYSTAVLARIAAEVVGMESDPALAGEAAARLKAAGVANALVHAGPLDRPPFPSLFHAIMVNGAVETVPRAWLKVLPEGGRLACVRGAGRAARAILLTRVGQNVAERVLFDAAAPALPEFLREPHFAF